jgi:hypothetical protein
MQEHEEEDDELVSFSSFWNRFIIYILMFVNKLMDVSLPQRLECVCVC